MTDRKLNFILSVSGLVLWAVFFTVNIKAQSTEQPSTTKVENTKNSKEISAAKISLNLDKYRLVFPESFEGACVKTKKNPGACYTKMDDTYPRQMRSALDNFVEQLNQLGEQGYRLDKVRLGLRPTGFVKADETQYEYAWFETRSPSLYAKAGFEEKYENYFVKGFRVIKHTTINQNCINLFDDNPVNGESCITDDIYLLEKEKSAKKTERQLLIHSSPGWGAKPSVELLTQINEKLADGFYPFDIFSRFEILLEETFDRENLLSAKPEFQVFRSDIRKNIDTFSKRGYRLTVANSSIAVMHRQEQNTDPTSYVWLNTDSKKFEKTFADLTAAGAVYNSFFKSRPNETDALIFERQNGATNEKREYKLLELDYQYTEKPSQGRVEVELKSSSKENIKTLNTLIKQGFKIRELFYIDNLTVLLER